MDFFYAQLDGNDIVTGVSQLSGEVEAAHMISIPVYDLELMRKKYNRVSQAFEAGPPRQIKVISSKTFWKRFTKSEREALSNSAAPAVKRFIDDIRVMGEVDLEDQEIIDDVNAAEAAGLIGAGRGAIILTTAA